MHSHRTTDYVCACVGRVNSCVFANSMMGFVLQNGWTPLVCASQNGHLEVVKSLIEAGAVNHTTKVV